MITHLEKKQFDEQIEVELLSIEQLGLLFKEGKLNDLKTSFAYLYLSSFLRSVACEGRALNNKLGDSCQTGTSTTAPAKHKEQYRLLF